RGGMMRMIYRHFKGGIYYLFGYVQLSQYSLLVEGAEPVAKATLEETMEEVDVYLTTDKRTKFTCMIVHNEKRHGTYCLYQDTKGKFWLRNKKSFFETLE